MDWLFLLFVLVINIVCHAGDKKGHNMSEDTNTAEAIKLGDNEYTPEQLNELVGYGQKYQEFEKKYDTDPEKAWSAYGKMSNEVKDLRDKAGKVGELEAELKGIKSQKPANSEGDYTPSQVVEAQAALKKLGGVTKEDIPSLLKEYGFVKKGDMDKEFETRRIVGEFENLSGKYNGEDGRPKFDRDEMIAFMTRTNMQDPEMAYRARFSDELSEFKAQRIIEEKYPQIKTSNKGAADKKPTVDPVNDENISKRLMEVMYPNAF